MGRAEFLERLGWVREVVESRLEVFLEGKLAEAGRISPTAEQLTRVLGEFTLRGGKRLRAALAYYGYRCFSGEDNEDVWKLGMSLELVQSFLLIHDDIIDRDETRRGGWTVHRYYEEHGGSQPAGVLDPGHFGESMAILCGDLAIVLAHEVLASLQGTAGLKEALMVVMERMIQRAIYGECMDVAAEASIEVSEEEILETGRLKTASYTIEGPLHVGAILGNASVEDLERLSRYAMPLGEAFQLEDDILGLFGEAEQIGKPVGSDIRGGKKTVLILRALEKATPDQRRFLERMLGRPDLTRDELESVRRLVVDTGALEACRQRARQLAEDSRAALLGCSWRREGVEFLSDAVEFMIQREY